MALGVGVTLTCKVEERTTRGRLGSVFGPSRNLFVDAFLGAQREVEI